MKYLLAAIATLVVSSFSDAAPPSSESVDRLLSAMYTQKSIDSMFQTMNSFMTKAIDQSFQGQENSEKRKQASEAYNKKMMVIIKDELSWEKMKTLYIQVYSESFSQEEVDGLTAFYLSPIGQAYLEKLPTVTQKSMTLLQVRMVPIMQRMQDAMKQCIAEAKSAN